MSHIKQIERHLANMSYTFYHTGRQSDSFVHSDSSDSVLYHHGILGMKWGVRRYQNEDGSLTAAGKERYRKLYMKYSDAYHDNMNRKKVSRAFRKFRNFSSRLHKDAEEHNAKPSDAQRLHRELEEELHKKYVDGLEVSEKYASLIKDDRKQDTLASDPKDKNLEFTESVANTMLWAGDPSNLEAFAEDVYKVKKGG